MVLAGILVSCNRVPKYDSRLIHADSLMVDIKNSSKALDILNSINPNELANEHDRAYHGLLITQARYKCYIKAENDSDINYALAYYSKHQGDKEKRARAYLYKGAVMEELNHPDSAMHYYKHAEEIIPPDDYFNLGYVNLRMGKVYNVHHAYGRDRDIPKLEKALEYFRKCENIHYQYVSLNDLGNLYRKPYPQKSQDYLNQALSLAQQEKDTINIVNANSNLAYMYFMHSPEDKSYNIKAYNQLQNIKQYGLRGWPNFVYTTFACIYANMGKTDSAKLLINMPLQNANSADSASYLQSNSYLEAYSYIALAEGDSLNYLKYSYKCDRNTFAKLNDSIPENIILAESNFDQEYQKRQDKKSRHRNYVIAAIILALMTLALLSYRRSHRYDKLILELKDQSHNQMQDLTDMQQNISELQINDERLKGFISSHMGMMREMIEACYHEPNNRIAENMKRIVKFQDSNKDNWVKLYDYIDVEHNNIMTRTRETYPDLNDRELLLLALTCMGFSYIQIAIIMGYSNATSVSVIKQRLVKKMGLDCSLNEYIQQNDNLKK